jgi:hypothetical protein
MRFRVRFGTARLPSHVGQTSTRLAAIVAADVAGYSRLVGVDEEATLTKRSACLS